MNIQSPEKGALAMNTSQSNHAEHVVQSFNNMLTDDARAHISKEQLEELALLIEAAIDASLVEQLGKTAAIAQKAADEIKKLSR